MSSVPLYTLKRKEIEVVEGGSKRFKTNPEDGSVVQKNSKQPNVSVFLKRT